MEPACCSGLRPACRRQWMAPCSSPADVNCGASWCTKPAPAPSLPLASDGESACSRRAIALALDIPSPRPAFRHTTAPGPPARYRPGHAVMNYAPRAFISGVLCVRLFARIYCCADSPQRASVLRTYQLAPTRVESGSFTVLAPWPRGSSAILTPWPHQMYRCSRGVHGCRWG